jgi:very-short-patch-repair endonuclease
MRWEDLQAKPWKRLSYGQYVSTDLRLDVRLKLQAVALRMPREYAFSGCTAAWILGLDMPPCAPVEVTIPRDLPARSRAGIRVRRAALPESDVIVRDGFRTTAPLRTVRDLGSRADIIESVVAIDMAVRAGLVELTQLEQHVASHPGDKGIKRLRRAAALADPMSESPMETRVRIEIIKARLPRPCVQVDLHDSSGNFLGRADLYYPDRKLIIEYDGENHRERLVADLKRQNALMNAGFHMLRFTASDLQVPGWVAAQVREARARLKRK